MRSMSGSVFLNLQLLYFLFCCYVVHLNIQCSSNNSKLNPSKRHKIICSLKYAHNVCLSYLVCLTFLLVTFCTWLATLLILCGDIHENPGPVNFSRSSSGSSVSPDNNSSIQQILNLPNHLSVVHYNVQSVLIRKIYCLPN